MKKSLLGVACATGIVAAGLVAAGVAATPASAASLPRCTNSAMSARLVNLQGAAGSVVGDLRLTNVSSGSCWTRGYPGVSYVGNGDGTQIGRAARWDAGTITTVTLAPGQWADSPIQMVDVHNYPAETCRPTPVDGLRVYVPGSALATFVRHPTTGCRSTAVTTISVKPLER